MPENHEHDWHFTGRHTMAGRAVLQCPCGARSYVYPSVVEVYRMKRWIEPQPPTAEKQEG